MARLAFRSFLAVRFRGRIRVGDGLDNGRNRRSFNRLLRLNVRRHAHDVVLMLRRENAVHIPLILDMIALAIAGEVIADSKMEVAMLGHVAYQV
jgi:hypothetical protein